MYFPFGEIRIKVTTFPMFISEIDFFAIKEFDRFVKFCLDRKSTKNSALDFLPTKKWSTMSGEQSNQNVARKTVRRKKTTKITKEATNEKEEVKRFDAQTPFTIYQNQVSGLVPQLGKDQIRRLGKTVRWILAQPHIEQGSGVWLFTRKFGITASDCYQAVHCADMFYLKTARPLDRYEVVELLLDKKSALGEPFEGNAATRHGQEYEPVVARLCSAREQTDLFQVGLLIHPRHRWLGASPDAVFPDGRLLEIKAPKSRYFKVGDPILGKYWVQCQIQTEVTGADEVLFYECRIPSTSKRARIKEPRINQILVKRDREWFSKALPLLENFTEAMYRMRLLSDLYGSYWLDRELKMACSVDSPSS